MAPTIVQPKPGRVEAPQTRRRTPQRTLDAIIRRAVLRELRCQQGNLSRTARELGIARQTLLNYLDAWKLRIVIARRVCRVLPDEAWAERALHKRFQSKGHGTWRDDGMRELTRRDMNLVKHGNSDEVARDAAADYWEMMSSI